MNELPSRSPNIHEIARLQRTSAEQLPSVFIEEYLLTPHGHKNMENLIYAIDGIGTPGGNDIERLVGRVKRILSKPDEDRLAQFTKLLLSEEGVERLNALEYVEAFRRNRAMSACLRFRERAQYDGAVDIELLYRQTLTILANITRYQILDHSYDPESPEWRSRGAQMVYIRGGEHHIQHLPNHPDNPYAS